MKRSWKYLIIILIIIVLLIGGYFAYREYQLNKLKKSYLEIMQCYTLCPGEEFTINPSNQTKRYILNITIQNQTTITSWNEECMENCVDTYKVSIPQFIWNFNRNYEYFQEKSMDSGIELMECINKHVNGYGSLDSLNDCVERVIEKYS